MVKCFIEEWWKLSNEPAGVQALYSMYSGEDLNKSAERNFDSMKSKVSPTCDLDSLNSHGFEITLRYDTPRNSNGSQVKFRYLYWAAYLGMTEVVEKLIRMGYSPFI